MDRFRLGVALLVVVVCLPGMAHAQGLFPFQGDTFELGGVELVPSLKVGYQKFSLSVNLPLPEVDNVYLGLRQTGALDLKLVDAGVWTGGIQLDGRRGRFFAFLGADINASKRVRAVTEEEPHRLTFLFPRPIEWTASGLEWWNVDFGLGYYLKPGVGVVAGLALDRLAFRMTEPHDSKGMLVALQKWMKTDYSADFLTKMSVPYVGVRIHGRYFKGLLRFSPVAFAHVKIPLAFFMDLSTASVYQSEAEKAEYTFKRSCLWLDAQFESTANISPNLRCGVWLKGNWHHLKGKGYENHSYRNADDQGYTYVIGSEGSMSGSASGTFTSTTLALGVSGEYAF